MVYQWKASAGGKIIRFKKVKYLKLKKKWKSSSVTQFGPSNNILKVYSLVEDNSVLSVSFSGQSQDVQDLWCAWPHCVFVLGQSACMNQSWAQVKNNSSFGLKKQSISFSWAPPASFQGDWEASVGSAYCCIAWSLGEQLQHCPHPPCQSSPCEVTPLCIWKQLVCPSLLFLLSRWESWRLIRAEESPGEFILQKLVTAASC